MSASAPAAMHTAADQRRFDVLLLGATGFVGRLVCEEIAVNYAGALRWAMAGRDKPALENVRSDLASAFGTCGDVPLLWCDVNSQDSIDAVVRQAKVVMCTTGPYELLAEPVIEACVRLGTHYLDLSGEVSWIRSMIERYHFRAEAAKVKVITACGYEAVGSDLGMYLLAKHMRERYNRKCARVDCIVMNAAGLVQSTLPGGGFSGSTWHSLMTMFGRLSMRETLRLQSPYYLVPAEHAKVMNAPDMPDALVPGYVPALRQWTAPFLLAPVDRKVVHRTNALLHHVYGDELVYKEHLAATGPLGAAIATLLSALVLILLSFRIFHLLLRLLVNKPGRGPPFDTQLKGSWKHIYVGHSQEDAGVPACTAFAILGDGGRDPGYWSTARILLESGLCLAWQQADIRQEGVAREGGVLTPVAAMGITLLHRLQKAGYTAIVREQHGFERKRAH